MPRYGSSKILHRYFVQQVLDFYKFSKGNYMFERFRQWYLENVTQITWFIIGAMIMSGLIYLAQGMYTSALISFAIAAANCYFNDK